MERVEGILNLLSVSSEGIVDNGTIVAAVRAKNSALAGQTDNDEAAVIQWLIFSEQQFTKDVTRKLNNILAENSFLVGQRLTLADAAIAWCIAHQKVELAETPHIARWFNHAVYSFQHNLLQGNKLVHPVVPISLPTNVSDVAVKVDPGDHKKTDIDIASKGTKKEEPQVEKRKELSSSNTPKDEKIDSPQDDMDPSKLDIRVGLVVKCWNHPDSEKLLCEEIDLGEGSIRLIASGIRAHYSAEDVQGRKVMVLSNLKERSIAGFKSQGMVLCASNKDHSVVRLLEPPASAKIGDRVLFNGFNGEPATPAQVAKKKIFETLAPFVSIRNVLI